MTHHDEVDEDEIVDLALVHVCPPQSLHRRPRESRWCASRSCGYRRVVLQPTEQWYE